MKPTAAVSKGTPLKLQILHLDPLGTFFIVPSLICLILALQWGGSQYAWSSGRVVDLLVVFAVLWLCFVLVQIFMNRTATLPARIIRDRNIIAGQVYMFCHGGALMVLVFLVPLYFQAIKGVSPVKSGVDTFPMILALVLSIIGGGVLTGKIGYYTPLAYASRWRRLDLHVESLHKPHMWIGYQIIAGFGLGLGFQAAITAAQTVLPQRDIAIGVSLIQFAQLLGGTVFISVAQNLLSSRLLTGLTPLVPTLTRNALQNIGATELRQLVAPDKLVQALEVYNDGLRHTFYLATGLVAAISLSAATLQWNSVKDPEEVAPASTEGEAVKSAEKV